jgi:hypothetical protein
MAGPPDDLGVTHATAGYCHVPTPLGPVPKARARRWPTDPALIARLGRFALASTIGPDPCIDPERRAITCVAHSVP